MYQLFLPCTYLMQYLLTKIDITLDVHKTENNIEGKTYLKGLIVQQCVDNSNTLC